MEFQSLEEAAFINSGFKNFESKGYKYPKRGDKYNGYKK
jgi:hypothetical protein